MKLFLLSLSFIICITGTIAQINYHQSPSDLRLYPRNIENNTAQVSFSAQVTDADVDSVVIIMERTDGLIERKSEAVTYLVDTSFTMSFEIEAITEDHNFFLYYIKGSQSLIVDSFKNIVAGDVFVIQGQSNAQANAYNGNANIWQDHYVRSFGNPSVGGELDVNWYLAEGNRGFVPGSIGQLGIRLARHLRDSLDIPVAFINAAHGGRAIEFFQRNDLDHYDSLTNYGRLLIRLRNAELINNIRSILFYQGESDGSRAEIHKSLFEELYADWNEDMPNVESFYVVQVRMGCGSPSINLRNYQRLFE